MGWCFPFNHPLCCCAASLTIQFYRLWPYSSTLWPMCLLAWIVRLMFSNRSFKSPFECRVYIFGWYHRNENKLFNWIIYNVVLFSVIFIPYGIPVILFASPDLIKLDAYSAFIENEFIIIRIWSENSKHEKETFLKCIIKWYVMCDCGSAFRCGVHKYTWTTSTHSTLNRCNDAKWYSTLHTRAPTHALI